MIIFYADSGWKLNLTNLKITFIEENALFFDAFFKNYTPPFSIILDDEISEKLGLIDEENISDYTVKHSGKIFLDNKFDDAYLLIELIEGDVEATIAFGKITIPLMDTPLSALPFPMIKNTLINTWAKAIKNKVYPEVSHAFPMVFDDEFNNESNYGAFEGIVNNYDGANYVQNSIENRVNNLTFGINDKGAFDASAGSFPGAGTAKKGDSYNITVAGAIDGVTFEVGDFIIALKDNASSSIYDANWLKYNATDIKGVVLNKNIMVPFPYLMEILKVGFESAQMQIIGEFVDNKANNHILIDPKKHLEKFSSATYDNYQFSQTTDEYVDGEDLMYEYTKNHYLNIIGSYTLKVLLNFPKEVEVKSLIITRDGTVVFSGVGNSISETINFNMEVAVPAETVLIKLTLKATSLDVSLYNNFEFEKSEGKLNVFKDTFSLSGFMLDMNFGALLAKIKNWKNLKVILSEDYVRMDYVENKFIEVIFKDETAFEMKNPKRVFNQSKLYKLKYTDTDFLLIDKNGLTNRVGNFRDEDVIEIDMGLQLLPVENRGTIFSAVRSNNNIFSMLLFNGVDANGNPVAVDNINGSTFSLAEIHNKYWEKWLHFRLNSEHYTDKFTAHSLEEFLINEGRFKYNKKHIYKKIKRTRISEEQWNFEIESESF